MNPEIEKKFALLAAVQWFHTAAVLGVLAERQIIDPNRVAVWARFFADGLDNGSLHKDGPEIMDAIRPVLRDFAQMIERYTTRPPGAGTA
jgi:hypothetical protein